MLVCTDPDLLMQFAVPSGDCAFFSADWHFTVSLHWAVSESSVAAICYVTSHSFRSLLSCSYLRDDHYDGFTGPALSLTFSK